jgi:multicomponent Na+:H+ antiporter subunit A
MMSPLLFVLIAAFGAAIAAPVARFTGQAAGWLLALIPAFLFISLVQLLPEVADGGVVMQVIEWAPAYGVNLGFRLDGFSVLFSMLITGIGTLVVIYAGTYFSGKEAKDRGRFLAFIILFMTAMLGTVMADDLIVLFVFWEMTSLVSFFLIPRSSRWWSRRAAVWRCWAASCCLARWRARSRSARSPRRPATSPRARSSRRSWCWC